jgi:hypothetical protein
LSHACNSAATRKQPKKRKRKRKRWWIIRFEFHDLTDNSTNLEKSFTRLAFIERA